MGVLKARVISHLLALAGSILLLTQSLYAQEVTVPWQPTSLCPEELPDANIAKESVSREEVAGVRVQLESATLSELAERFAVAVGHAGDASESRSWVCLQGEDVVGRWALWLLAGELHGGRAGAMLLRRLNADDRADGRCEPVRGEVVVGPVDLQLGLTEARVAAKLGPPSLRLSDTLVWVHAHDESIVPKLFDVGSTLCVRFQPGELEAFEVWRVTSN